LKDMCCATAIAGIALYAGYRIGRSAEAGFQYAVEVNGEQYVVKDRASGVVQPITRDFQLGGIDYRVDGLFRDMKRAPDLVERSLIEGFHKNYMPREEPRTQWASAQPRWSQ
ncbi:MAG: hypothetical protein AABY13_04250, partial [Nanoarchaeota archaeon]